MLKDGVHLAKQTTIEFECVFEEETRRVRCQLRDVFENTLRPVTYQEKECLSGRLSIELTACVDAETGKPLNWPPQALLLRGVFEKLPDPGDLPDQSPES